MSKLLVVAGQVLLLLACKVSAEKLEFKRGEEAAQKGNHAGALAHFKNVVEKYEKSELAIQAAKEAARISHYQLKKPQDAVGFYKYIVLYAPNSQDRIEAQKKLANLHLTETLDYKQAIVEFSRLLDLSRSSIDDFTYRLSIARCYFYLSNFYQAQVEIDSILGRGYDRELLFDALLLKANIFLTMKKLDDAIITLKEMMTKYPERSKTETIGLVLAVAYEEQKNFNKAIETLESIKEIYPKKAFIEARIKILRERQTYLPGARGWRK